MPALCSMLRLYHYAQNYAGIMYLTLNFSWVLQSSRRIEDNGYANFRGRGRKQGALWSM